MFTPIRVLSLLAALAFCGVAQAADSYSVDPVHSSISFMIQHQGISDIHGRFNDFSGTFMIDSSDPAKSTFSLSIPVESIDTNNKKRDEHLCAPDYFNAKQFPNLTFQSTSVKPTSNGYEVTGDLTIHGVTKQVTMKLVGGRKAVEFPKGTKRVGVTTELTINRNEFGLTAAPGGLGEDVHIVIGLEAASK